MVLHVVKGQMSCDTINPEHANLYLQALAVVATLVLNEENIIPDMHIQSDPIWINICTLVFLSISHYSLFMCIIIGIFTLFFNVLHPCTSTVNIRYPSYYFVLAIVSHFIGGTFWSITFNGGFISDTTDMAHLHSPPDDVKWFYLIIGETVKYTLIVSAIICMYILYKEKFSKIFTVSGGSISL